MGREARAAAVDALQNRKDLRSVDIIDRAFGQPRKDIIPEAGRRLFVLTDLDKRLALFHPAFGDDFKRVGCGDAHPASDTAG